jgi:hypothetical protein
MLNWVGFMTGFQIIVFGVEQEKVTKSNYNWLPGLILGRHYRAGPVWRGLGAKFDRKRPKINEN